MKYYVDYASRGGKAKPYAPPRRGIPGRFDPPPPPPVTPAWEEGGCQHPKHVSPEGKVFFACQPDCPRTKRFVKEERQEAGKKKSGKNNGRTMVKYK